MSDRLFVDTSAWFAYANRSDRHHAPVRDLFRKTRARLLTTNYIFDETVTLCLYRLGHGVAERVGRTLRDGASIDVVRITADDETQAWALFQARPDQRYSFTDCTSFVLMRRLGLQRCAAVDGDFDAEGFECLPRLPSP